MTLETDNVEEQSSTVEEKDIIDEACEAQTTEGYMKERCLTIAEDMVKRGLTPSLIIATDTDGMMQCIGYDQNHIVNHLSRKTPIVRMFEQEFGEAGMRDMGYFYTPKQQEIAREKKEEKQRQKNMGYDIR